MNVSTIKRLLQVLKNEEKIRRIGAKRGRNVGVALAAIIVAKATPTISNMAIAA